MRRTLNGFGIMLAMLAVLGLASPVFACGGKESKEKSTTAQKTDQEKESAKKSDSETEEKEESSEEPTKS